MKTLTIRPYKDRDFARTCGQLLDRLIQRLRANDILVTDIKGARASPRKVRQELAQPAQDAIIITFFGHGAPHAWLSTPTDVFMSARDFAGLKNLQIHTYACWTGNELGPNLVEADVAEYYVGYSGEIGVWCYGDTGQPCEGFEETAVAGIEIAVSGRSDVRTIEDAIRREYYQWIAYWDEKGYLPVAAYLRNNLNFLSVSG